MDKTRKKSIKRYISWGLLAALVVLLAVMPLIAADSAEDDGPVATVKSGTVETGTITNMLNGGGTLSEDTAVDITIPTGVKLTEFLVDNGDVVSQGDALAAVDPISVMTAIAEVQDTLDYLDGEIASVDSGSGATTLSAQTAGKVKLIYAEAGDNVQEVILEHGALAVLSLDGRMALDLETDANLRVGDSVLVTVEEGEAVTGRVDSTLGDTVIISIPDEDYEVGAAARVSNENGDHLGEGVLYIHNPWNVTAYYGTVSKVSVAENDDVYAGRTLMTLEDTDHSSQYEILLGQRRDYEEVMQKLFQMYQTGTVTAPCDGIVSGVDENSVYLLSGENGGWFVQLLSNLTEESETGGDGESEPTEPSAPVDPSVPTEPVTPPEEPVTTYHYFGKITETGTLLVDYSVCYQNVTADMALTLSYNEQNMITPAVLPGMVSTAGGESAAATPGDIVLLTSTQEMGSFVSGLIVVDVPGEAAVTPGTQLPGILPGMTGMAGMAGMAGGFTGGSIIMEPTFTPYDLTENTILSVTPKDVMTLDITIDELDIGRLTVGQAADITITALTDETAVGTVTEIGSAENEGGNSKFTVTITMDRSENMLSGMSASAAMELGTVENALTIPVAALVEDGAKTFVYTGYDAASDTLGDPAEVTLGASDGEKVQILSGLEAGDTYYYSYYDAQETP